MLDIIGLPDDGRDLLLADAAAPKAANIVQTQFGSLEYAPLFGVDLKFFLESRMQFQNESFKAYIVERLTHHEVNVSEVRETIEALFETYTFAVGDAEKPNEGMIR